MSPARDYYLPERRLVSQDDAAITERANVPRSRFTGSWTRKTAFDAGYLVPFLIDEILPGDHMTYDTTAYIRMATPLFPLFDNQTFIEDNPPMERVLAAGELAEDQQYLADIMIHRNAVRLLPAFGTPAILGRF